MKGGEGDMNGSNTFFPFAKKNEAHDTVRESNEALPPRSIFVSALNLLLCSLLIPFMLSGNETATYAISLIACLTSTVVMFTSAKKISHAVLYTVAMVLFLGTVVLPLLPALIFGSVVAIGSGAALISTGKGLQNLITPVMAVLAFTVSLIACGDPLIALTALALYLPVVVLGIASRIKVSFSAAVISCTATLLLLALLAIGATIYLTYGSVSSEALNQGIDSLTATLISYAEMSMKELMGIEVNEAWRNMIVIVVDYYVNISPGLIVAACTVASYFALKIEHNSLEAHGIDRLLDEHTTMLSVGAFPALLYILAVVLSFALDPYNEISVIAIVADNICLILSPALLIMTGRALRALPAKLGFIGLLISGFLVLFMILAFYAFPMIVALVGAVYVLIISVDAWAKEHYSKGENQ